MAALITDRYLRQKGVTAGGASEAALELAAILTGREVAGSEELRRAHRQLGKPNLDELSGVLSAQFEWWVTHDGVESQDPAPSPNSSAECAAWRARHRPLPKVLSQFGTDSLALEVLRRMPAGAWNAQDENGRSET